MARNRTRAASMQFHMIGCIPLDSMHEVMISLPSMHFHARNHVVPYMELHEKKTQKFDDVQNRSF